MLNKYMVNQKGAVPVLILLAVIVVIAAIAIVNLAPFKNNLLANLFPKKGSYAFASDDWVTKGGDFSRSYFRATALPLTATNKLNLQWKKFLGERIEVEMEPIVVGNSIFIGVMNGKIYSLNKTTGATQWVYQTGGPLTDTPTAFTNTSGQLRLAVPSTDGKLYVLDGSSGQKIWEYQTGEAIMSTPVFDNNTIFIGSMDNTFYALDASDSSSQRVKWSNQTTGPISTTPALGSLGNGQMGVFVANGSNMAYGFNVNGTKLWEKQLGGAYTKRTTAVYGNGKVIFVTKKPGRENSSVTEDVPTILSGNTKQPIDVVISNFADFYQIYPERRTLYVLNAQNGADMWQPTVDKTKYTPLYIPYWGEYSPVIDTNANFAYYPITTGYAGGNLLDHDFRLIKLDLATGNMIQIGPNGGANVRPDEFGRMNLIGTRLFQTMNEDIGYYDISNLTLNNAVFGTFSDGRWPLELNELPNPSVYGGMEKHFTRFGGSSTSAFGGGNDEVSPLIVSGNQAFMITMGHLYAFTGQSVGTLSKEYLSLDLTSGPPSKISDKTQVKQMLTNQIQQIVNSGKHIDPVSRFWNYSQNLNSIDVNFWHEGEVVRALSEAVPLVDEPVKSGLKTYLKTEVQNQLLNANLYQFRRACINFKTKLVEDPCSNATINSGWYWSNYLLTGKRLYALYKYAQMTGDWSLIQTNWNFIKARYADITPASQYDANAGFFLYQGFVSGPFSPDIQMGAMLGVSEMAKQVGDTTTQASADNYLNSMKQKRPYWGKYVRSLYDSGVLTRTDFPDKNDWGVNQNIFIPVEGYMDKTNDFRQPYAITKNTDGTFKVDYSNLGTVFPYNLVGFGPFYPEFGDFINQNLGDELKDYIDMLERYDAWWYMGNMNHQPINGQHEEESLSPQIAPAIFQAKAYVFKQNFDALKNYLPWEFENYGYKDIYRIQNMVALLNTPGGTISSTNPSSTPTPAPSVNTFKIMPLGDSLTLGVGDNTSSGYRKNLLVSLVNTGINPDYVGSYVNGTLSDPNHEGVSGNSINQISTRIDTGILTQYSPQMILLLAGTNDIILNGNSAQTAITNLNLLVDKIFQIQPNVTLVMGTIPYKVVNNQFTMQSVVDSYNSSIQNMVNTRKAAGQKIYFSPTASVLTDPTADFATDGIHPSITGYNKMADIWFQTIQPLIVPATTSPTPSSSVSGKIGDIDGNDKVDIFDYNLLLSNYGKSGQSLQGDLNNSGKVDIFDYNLLLTNFGK